MELNERSIQEAITYDSLILVLGGIPVPVSWFEIEERPGTHGSMTVTLETNEQLTDYILYEGEGEASLLCQRNGVAYVLFQGLVIQMNASAGGGLFHIRLEVKTASYLMDLHKGSFSYQDVGITSHQLLASLLGGFPGSQVLLFIPDVPVGRIAVQYQETAWEFMNRFLSEYNAQPFADSTGKGIRLRLGLPDMEDQVNWDDLPYTVRRDASPRDVTLQLKGQVSYEIETYDILPLGTQVRFHNQELYIGRIYRRMEDGLLNNRYHLYFKEGLQIRKYYNPLLSGVSLYGVVTGIVRDKVQVQLEADALENCKSRHYFPFSSVAASPDGSGWYCMPKMGDPVRIFFPTQDEEEGYAISNAQGQSEPAPDSPMGNPNLKDITTPDEKTVKFIENGILLSVASGKGTVTLTNDGKAEITSEKSIVIGAANKVDASAGEDSELKLSAGVSIQIISKEGSSIAITEDTVESNAAMIINN